MKILIWVGGYLLMSLIYTLTYGIFEGTRTYVQFIEAVAYLVIWIIVSKLLCKKWDIQTVQKEAFAQGLSIRQYIDSIVPPSLISACEVQKGNRVALKENLKRCVEENAITKPVSVVLFEMYK